VLMRIRKKPYLLLELIIALTLVLLCALPLVHAPLSLVKGEIQAFARMEAIRLSDLAFAEVLAKLYRNEISWDLIAKGEPVLFQKEMSTQVEGICKQTFLCTSTLRSMQKKEGKNQEDLRLVKITISFETKNKLWQVRSDPHKIDFVYEVFVAQMENPIAVPS
jgi:hypothetical protein